MRKNKAKGLVLTKIFTNCYIPKREMTVNQLLDADKQLNAQYCRHPHVLSNTLRRYYKQGLLYRFKDPWRMQPYFYGMTEKGLKRLLWMANNRKLDYSQAEEFSTQYIALLEKKISAIDERQIERLIEIEALLKSMET